MKPTIGALAAALLVAIWYIWQQKTQLQKTQEAVNQQIGAMQYVWVNDNPDIAHTKKIVKDAARELQKISGHRSLYKGLDY